MGKHTEMPWKVENDLTIRSMDLKNSTMMGDYRGNVIVDLKPAVGIYNERYSDGIEGLRNSATEHRYEEAKANARLIAAAPELLEASKKALEFFEAWTKAFDTDPAQSDIHQSLIRAIEKAEGDK